MTIKRPSLIRNCTVQMMVLKVATTFFVFCEFTTVFARKSFSRPRPDFTPQTVLIHLKKAPDGMIVPQSEFGIYSTNSSKKSSWWNDCSSTRDRKHPGQVSILYQRQAAWSPNFPQRWRSVPHVPLHLYGRQMRILPIGRKNLNPRPKAAEFFLMSNTVFPEFLAPQNGGWLTTVTRNQCCRSRTLPKTTS